MVQITCECHGESNPGSGFFPFYPCIIREGVSFEFSNSWFSECNLFYTQRLAEDSNPTIAAAASKTIYELKKQWEIEEGDSWRFTMNQMPMDQDEVVSEGLDDDDSKEWKKK